MPSGTQFWLWVSTIATAVAGAGLSLWGTALQKRSPPAAGSRPTAHYLVLAGYALTSVSVLLFALRGLIG